MCLGKIFNEIHILNVGWLMTTLEYIKVYIKFTKIYRKSQP